MSFHSWLQNLRSALVPRRIQHQKRRGSLRAATHRLNLEPLEPRCLLTGFLITVTTAFDVIDPSDGLMSLREAVERSNQLADTADTITFSSSLAGKPVLLTGGQMTITDAVTIRGLGSMLTTVSGRNSSRLFDITGNAGAVTFERLTLASGLAAAPGEAGGAIRSASLGELKLLNSVVADNEARGAGGGIFAHSDVTLVNCTIENNSTTGEGGYGGGLAVLGAATIVNSTIHSNDTRGDIASGGGIFAYGPLSITNSTLTGNGTNGHHGRGGGGAFATDSVTIVNSTIADNYVGGLDSGGGGLACDSGPVTILSSIVARNETPNFSDVASSHPDLLPAGRLTVAFSLIGDNNGTDLTAAPLGAPDAAGNFIGIHGVPIDPLLTQSGLGVGSPALNRGFNPGALATDQRGFPRLSSSAVDMGAFEMQAPSVVLGGTLTYVENAPPLVLAPGATVSDLDNANFRDGKLYVRIRTNANVADRLAVQNQGIGPGRIGVSGTTIGYENGTPIGTISGGAGSAPLVVSLTGYATPASVQALVRAITFRTLTENPTTAPRSITFALDDGQGLSSNVSTATKTVNVTAVNDVPVLKLSGTIGYVHDSAAIVLAATAAASDRDSLNFATGRLKVHISTGASSTNVLAIGAGFTVDASNHVKQGTTIIGTLNANGGQGTTDLIVTFNTSATPLVAQALVRAITFKTVGRSTGTRSVIFSLTDGDGGTSAHQPKTVNVT